MQNKYQNKSIMNVYNTIIFDLFNIPRTLDVRVPVPLPTNFPLRMVRRGIQQNNNKKGKLK